MRTISDNTPLYTVKEYKVGLELINENVPLNRVQNSLSMKHILQMKNAIKDKQNKCKFTQPCYKYRIDDKSDKLCAKCEINPNHHPDGCNL